MTNMKQTAFVLLLATLALSSASPMQNATHEGLRDSCVLDNAKSAAAVTARCKKITVKSFAVPAGQTLKLALQYGTVLTFEGDIAFAYAEWDGPLMWITGDGITVQGAASHLIDGRGALWWDGKGDHSNKKKPQLMLIQATGGSVFKGIKIKNCPHTCIGISDSHDLTLQNWDIDNRDGDAHGGANTDGFDFAKSYKVTIKDTSVWNQDDCICINQGQHIMVDNLQCTGGHGLSIAAGLWSDYSLNTIYNVTFQNSVIQNSRNGIHIKTIAGSQQGEITAVTYRNIKLSGISYNAINVQQDYTNDGSTGYPMGNIKIKQLALYDVYGTMNGPNSQSVYILCGSGGCSDWSWTGVNINGAVKSNSCNFAPNGFFC